MSSSINPLHDNDSGKSPSGSIRTKNNGEIFYGWWLVGVGVVLLSLMSLGVFRGMSVMTVVLQREFGWTRTQISLSSLFNRVEGAALGPIEGYLIDRIGARKMVLVGFSLMAVGFVLFSLVQNIWQFYAVFLLITLGSGIGGWLAVIAILNNWFDKQRTMALACAMSGIILAGFFIYPYTKALEASFRGTVFCLGLIIFIVALPSVKILRNKPEDMGLMPDGDHSELIPMVLAKHVGVFLGAFCLVQVPIEALLFFRDQSPGLLVFVAEGLLGASLFFRDQSPSLLVFVAEGLLGSVAGSVSVIYYKRIRRRLALVGSSASQEVTDSPPIPTEETLTHTQDADILEVEKEQEFTVTEALRTPVFWILTFAHLSSTISLATLSIHLAPRLTDMGLSLSTASKIELLQSLVALPILFFAGWLGDQISKKYLVTIFLLLQGISTLVLALGNTLPMAILFAVLYGVAFGGRIPLMTSIRGEYFGRKAFASIMGWSMLPNGIVMAVAPVWAGWVFDNYGQYTVPFLAFAIINIVGAFIMLFARKPKLVKTPLLHN